MVKVSLVLPLFEKLCFASGSKKKKRVGTKGDI